MERNNAVAKIVLEGIEEQIKDLQRQKEKYIDELKEEGKLTFDLWLEYANKEHHIFLLGEDEAPLIREMVWDCNRYETITVYDVLDWAEDWENEDLESLKKELMNNNFGSMVADW